jgi:hypothetical protein
MSSLILIAFIVSGLIALKNRTYWIIAGCIVTKIHFFLFNSFENFSFLISFLFGLVASVLGTFIIPWFFSGFKGGNHSTGPSYIGGGSGRGHGPGGGIVLYDEERDKRKPENHIR